MCMLSTLYFILHDVMQRYKNDDSSIVFKVHQREEIKLKGIFFYKF